jgi:acetyl-CoA acetyltransferase
LHVTTEGKSTMPDAVIVATARSPIGRARKGSLRELRPDDLAATMVRAALEQVPQLDVRDIDDLMLGCAQPAGEHGYNLARVVSVLSGMGHVPGTTVNRYCSSSVQTSRMAMHAIRAGEGEVFISAGVEAVSRYEHGKSDGMPGTHNPVFASAQERSARQVAEGATWSDPRQDGGLPDMYLTMGLTAEIVASSTASPAPTRTSSPSAPSSAPNSPSPAASGLRTSPRSPSPTEASSPPTTVRAPASPPRPSPSWSRSSAPTGR